MLHPFGRHARAFAQALDTGAWQRTSDGILFPAMGALLAGRLSWRAHDRNGRLCGEGAAHNLLTDYALGKLRPNLLPVGSGHSAFSPVYLAPFGNNVAVDASWSDYYLASPAGAGELGDGPEGYSEPNRPDWTAADGGSGLVSNAGAPATCTIVTATQVPVYGFAVVGVTNAKRSGLSDAIPFDPTVVMTEIPDIDESTPYGRHLSVSGVEWYDPNGDDIFDMLGGHWTDPTLDDVQIASNQSIYALIQTAPPGSPTLYNNGDTLTMIYELELAT